MVNVIDPTILDAEEPGDTGLELHDGDESFCYDGSCPCHEDQDAIDSLEQARQDGEATVADCDNIFNGRTV